MKKFFEFLKENDALDKYVTNVPDIRIIKPLNPHQYVAGPFLWEYSEEGFIYWCNLNSKWIRELDSYNF